MPVRRALLSAVAGVIVTVGAAADAAARPRWEFTITGTSTVTFDYGINRERICNPDRGGEPTIGTARYENAITGTATVREMRHAGTRSGWGLWRGAPIRGTVRQSATETWDDHNCPAGTPAPERTCTAPERTGPLNRTLHRLNVVNTLGKRSYVNIGHNQGYEGRVFPSLTVHCNAGLFTWLDERLSGNRYAGRYVLPSHWRRRSGTLVLEPDRVKSPFRDPSWGTVDYRVTLKWRRIGGPPADTRGCRNLRPYERCSDRYD